MSASRIEGELQLIRRYYPNLSYVPEGQWILLPEYRLPADMPWSHKTIEVAFTIPANYPAAPPYGIYIKEGLTVGGAALQNYNCPSSQQPPFTGKWGVLSWSPEDPWKPTADLVGGSNLLNFIHTFQDRFRQGA